MLKLRGEEGTGGGPYQHRLCRLLDWMTGWWGTELLRGRDRRRSSASGPPWSRQSPGYGREGTARRGGMLLEPRLQRAKGRVVCAVPSSGSSTSCPWAFRRPWMVMEGCRGSPRTCQAGRGQAAKEAEGKNGLCCGCIFWAWIPPHCTCGRERCVSVGQWRGDQLRPTGPGEGNYGPAGKGDHRE